MALDPRCPYCAQSDWSPALGGDHLKVPGIILGEYDREGRVTHEPGIEVEAFTCRNCGHVRFRDPSFDRADV